MHVLLEWIQTCYLRVCVTRMYNCTCNASKFYKTFIYVIQYSSKATSRELEADLLATCKLIPLKLTV